jgi:hypothetical protein
MAGFVFAWLLAFEIADVAVEKALRFRSQRATLLVDALWNVGQIVRVNQMIRV